MCGPSSRCAMRSCARARGTSRWRKRWCDAMDAACRKDAPIALRLTTAPGVRPVTASAFVATIDDIARFRSAHELEAYLGLIPSERSSGEKRQLGHMTKAGNGRMRWLLVEAAWQILRSKSPETAALRAWTVPLAKRVD